MLTLNSHHSIPFKPPTDIIAENMSFLIHFSIPEDVLQNIQLVHFMKKFGAYDPCPIISQFYLRYEHQFRQFKGNMVEWVT